MNRFSAIHRSTRLFVGILVLSVSAVAAAPPPFQAQPEPDPAPWGTALPAPALEVTGQVLYGSAQGARTAAVVDIVEIYSRNPAYMRLKALGLQETQGRGKALFDEARASTNKALAEVARRHRLDVITVPGGVNGCEASNLTAETVELLPVYAIEGALIHGLAVREPRSVGEIDSPAVLASMPAYVEWCALRPDDARYHLLQKAWQEAYAKAVRKVTREQNLDGLAEKGNVTSRLGQVPDVTRAVVQALAS